MVSGMYPKRQSKQAFVLPPKVPMHVENALSSDSHAGTDDGEGEAETADGAVDGHSNGSHRPAFWQLAIATCCCWQLPQSGHAAAIPHVTDCDSWQVRTVVDQPPYCTRHSAQVFTLPAWRHASSTLLSSSQSAPGFMVGTSVGLSLGAAVEVGRGEGAGCELSAPLPPVTAGAELRLEDAVPTTTPAVTAAATTVAITRRTIIVSRRRRPEGPGAAGGTGVASTRIDRTGSASNVTTEGSAEGGWDDADGGAASMRAAGYEGTGDGAGARTDATPGDARYAPGRGPT
jgi:hypothetical protein